MSNETLEPATRRRSIRELARFLSRHRLASAVVALVGMVIGLWAWWATQLWGLPDIGDPFDVAAFENVHVPDDRNAFLWYRDAASLTTALSRKMQAEKRQAMRKFEGEWSKASPAWRDFLAQSGEALAIWRAGSEKPDARYDHPEGISIRTLLPVTMELRTLAKLGILEGARLEAEGDMAGAWGWYRGALRSSRHSGKHGFLIERLTGGAMHKDASDALTRWASDPKVDAPMLRQALDEVIAIDAMTVPRSETVKLEYLLLIHTLDDPNLIEDVLLRREAGEPADWCQELPVSDTVKKPIQEARLILADDRERTLRLSRLMTANWLAEVDKPPHRRARLARNDPPIYEADPAAPPSSRVLSPKELSEWLDSSLVAGLTFRLLSKFSFALDLERTRQAGLVVHLADQLHRREHGGTPPPSPEALVGPYLKALPECFNPAAAKR